jgi:NADH:ubiquinone oxidoreductase subunit 5 (subunit L)/multisubunit Na+/H+ antiporter MnhA subunit
MVARTYPLYEAAGPVALQTVAWVGGITAIFAATSALVQSDFKRVLAFSTISQLGYMFVGLGVANEEFGSGPGMFHLFTHAFFKALLFLGAGSVIHALHHATHREVQDMREMGGLGPKMPITAATWLIAVMAISGFPFFSGFYSKEFIIGQALEEGNYALYAITLLTAGLTAFYMLRAFILAFGGKGGKFGGLWGGSYRGEGHPHEAPWTVTVPLLVLAVFAIIAGYWLNFFTYIQPDNPHIQNLNFMHLFEAWDTWVGVAVSFVGLGLAWWMYGVLEPAKLKAFVEDNAFLIWLHRLLYNRYYVDTVYDGFVRYVVFSISYVSQAFDTYVVDGLVNGVGKAVTGFGSGLRRTENGRVQTYMVGFFGGIAVLAVIVYVVLLTWGRG